MKDLNENLDELEREGFIVVEGVYEGTWFVSRARGYQGTFPFAEERKPRRNPLRV